MDENRQDPQRTSNDKKPQPAGAGTLWLVVGVVLVILFAASLIRSPYGTNLPITELYRLIEKGAPDPATNPQPSITVVENRGKKAERVVEYSDLVVKQIGPEKITGTGHSQGSQARRGGGRGPAQHGVCVGLLRFGRWQRRTAHAASRERFQGRPRRELPYILAELRPADSLSADHAAFLPDHDAADQRGGGRHGLRPKPRQAFCPGGTSRKRSTTWPASTRLWKSCARVVEFLKNPDKYRVSGRGASPRAFCSSVPPARARPCSPGR